MLFLKRLRLQNFCNFENHTFDFTKADGSPYPFICFYGPNGIGKSTLLEAIGLLTSDQTGRPVDYVRNSLRKYVRNPDYNPAYQKLKGHTYQNAFIAGSNNDALTMEIEGVYEYDGQEYSVIMNQDGWVKNEFATGATDRNETDGPWFANELKLRRRICHSIKTDSDLSLNSFQIHLSYVEEFEEIVSAIMRYPIQCVQNSDMTETIEDFCTDVVLIKNKHNIHFKRMSAGERKILKSFSEVLNLMNTLAHPKPGDPAMPGWPKLLLMDNVVMHVYYDRHVAMIDCLKRIFHQQQIFATTHSGTLISRQAQGENDQESELWFDLEKINS
jgi:predicted ATP-binding protein involved in virulence